MSQPHNTGLLGYQLSRYITDRLIDYELSPQQNIEIQNIIDNWYNVVDDNRFENLPLREEFDRIVDYYRYRIKTKNDELYLYEYYQLLTDVADVIRGDNLYEYSRDIVAYLTQRLGNIDESKLYSLIHSIYELNILTFNGILNIRELDRLQSLFVEDCSNDEAYRAVTELYDTILQALGHPKNREDIDEWERLSIYILSNVNTECEYVKSYIQQLFKSFERAKLAGNSMNIPRLIKDVVIIG